MSASTSPLVASLYYVWCVPQVHYLSGPINVKDADGKLAQPGDLLAVELCQLGPLPGVPRHEAHRVRRSTAWG